MYNSKLLNEVLQTYIAQGSAIVKQLDFADFMIDDFLKRLDELPTLPLDSVANACRTFIKYYDLRERLTADSKMLADEQRILEYSISPNG